MKNRAILTIVIAIFTGFIIGYITANQVRHIRTRDVRSMSSVHTFKDRTFEIIQPTEEQIIALTPLVDEYALEFDSLRESTSEIFKNFLEEFHKDIYPLLEEEQINRMEEFGKFWRKPKKEHQNDSEASQSKKDSTGQTTLK